MRTLSVLSVLALLLAGCNKELEAPVPAVTWDLFESSNAVPLSSTPQQAMRGVYSVAQGTEVLGDRVALKWTWSAQGMDTTYHVSLFTGLNAGYFIGQGKSLGGDILLNGYWRQMTNTSTGLMRLTISDADGGSLLLGPNPQVGPDSIIIHGVFGDGQEVPLRPVELRYLRPLFEAEPMECLAHRCGGRTSDLLPVSENSLEMIRYATRFGATGVEMDVRLTSDGVPVLYHDNTLNLRLIQPCGLVGPIEDYTYAQLSGLVRLVNGEKIPTLRQALYSVVHETPLHVVWLDTKYSGPLDIVRTIQEEFMQEAAAAGRDVRFLIGLPGEDQFNEFLQLPNYTQIPSLCELELDDVRAANSRVWGPRWTLGTQDADVAAMHAEGRQAFVWTVDDDAYIRLFVQESQMDGVLSNYPALVAYHHYAR